MQNIDFNEVEGWISACLMVAADGELRFYAFGTCASFLYVSLRPAVTGSCCSSGGH
jgi:hypothetical protein